MASTGNNRDSTPSTYDARLTFRSDHSGNRIVVRPNQILSSGNPRKVQRAIFEVWAEICGQPAQRVVRWRPPGMSRPISGDWRLYRIDRVLGVDAPGDRQQFDVIRFTRGLRERGLTAQPNHVYFVDSIGTTPARSANSFAPNTFAPNTFAPNTFAPNTFAPNTFAPNTFAPNTFAGGAAQGGGCCCSDGIDDATSLVVPRLLARPAEDPGESSLPVEPITGEQRVQVHVIDIASLRNAGTTGAQPVGPAPVGEFEAAAITATQVVDSNTPKGDDVVDPAAGHGDFVQSVLRRHSGLKVMLWEAADPLGDIDDKALVKALRAVDLYAQEHKTGDDRKVLNLSLSGYNEDDRPGLILADQIQAMIEDGWVIVASAGNNASCRLAWPAALPGVVSVGALSQCAPAWFSNYGPWVDVSAPGVNIVAEYPKVQDFTDQGLARTEVDRVLAKDKGEYGCIEVLPYDSFSTGWASWSGTSFSAPLIAGRIARHLHDTSPASVSSVPESDTRTKAIQDAYDHVFRRNDLDWVPHYGRLVT